MGRVRWILAEDDRGRLTFNSETEFETMFYQLDLCVFKTASIIVVSLLIRGDSKKKPSCSTETKYCPTLPPSSPTEIKYKMEGRNETNRWKTWTVLCLSICAESQPEAGHNKNHCFGEIFGNVLINTFLPVLLALLRCRSSLSLLNRRWEKPSCNNMSHPYITAWNDNSSSVSLCVLGSLWYK